MILLEPRTRVMNAPKKLFIKTYGCQMNVVDSEVVAAILQKQDYQVTEKIDEASLILVNTVLHGLRRVSPWRFEERDLVKLLELKWDVRSEERLLDLGRRGLDLVQEHVLVLVLQLLTWSTALNGLSFELMLGSCRSRLNHFGTFLSLLQCRVGVFRFLEAFFILKRSYSCEGVASLALLVRLREFITLHRLCALQSGSSGSPDATRGSFSLRTRLS